MFQRKEEGEGRREGEMFKRCLEHPEQFSLCSECSKAQAVKEIF